MPASPTNSERRGTAMHKHAAFVLILAAAARAAELVEPAELVREAAAGWTQTAVKQDAAGLKRFMADDLQYAHAGGQTQTRAEYIAAVTNGPARYESFTFSDLK